VRLGWLRRHAVLWSVQFAYMAEYRAEILLWALSGVLPFIMLAVWSGAAVPGLGLGSVPPSGRYFLSAFVVRQFTVVWVVWQFEEDTIQGRLSPYLLQPMHPLWRYVAAHQAEQATRLPFVLLIVSVFFLLQPASFAWPGGPGRLVLGILAVGLAFALNFLLQSLIACLCFWSERATCPGATAHDSLPVPLRSGGAPAGLPAGDPAAGPAHPLPLPDRVPRPVAGRGIGGGCWPVQPGFGLRHAVAWLAVLFPLLVLLWRAGVRRYGAMGA
jgi:ABC-2 type transport system permease protein